MIRMMLAGAVALAVTACTTLTSAERESFREAIVNEMLYRIDQLQQVGVEPLEVDAKVLIAADAACSALSIGSPFLVEAINRKLEADTDPVTLEEFQNSLHDACDVVRALLKVAPDEALMPEPAPET